MSLATPSVSITSTHDLTETSTSKFSGKIYGQVRVIVYSPSFFSLIYNHVQKSWDTFAFPGRFPIHTGPTPPLTPQTMLDACIQNFFRVSILYRVGGGGGRTARKFRRGCTVLIGNRELAEKYEYYSTVPRTFVQDCSLIITRSVWYGVVLFMLNQHYYPASFFMSMANKMSL